MMVHDLLTTTSLLGLTSVAAATDCRTGHIPNWLTLSSLAFAPLLRGVAQGGWGALTSIGGAIACAAVPWLLYRASKGAAIGGGDLKLFAAIGALVGPVLGIEIELLAFVLLACYALLRLTFHGKLSRVLLNTLRLVLNPLLPLRLRRAVVPEALTAMRLGPFIAVSAFTLVVLDHPQWWPL